MYDTEVLDPDLLTEADCDDLLTLICEFSPDASRLSVADVQSCIWNNYQVVARHEESRQIIGMATLVCFRTLTRKAGHIEDVAVLKQWRGQGVGAALIRALITDAQHKQLSHLDLTSNPRRRAARKLYQNLGFVLRETGCFRLVI